MENDKKETAPANTEGARLLASLEGINQAVKAHMEAAKQIRITLLGHFPEQPVDAEKRNDPDSLFDLYNLNVDSINRDLIEAAEHLTVIQDGVRF